MKASPPVERPLAREGRWPFLYAVPVLVALGGAAGLTAFHSLAMAGPRAGSRFWSEVALDVPVAWLCAMLVIVAGLLTWFAPGRVSEEREVRPNRARSWRWPLGAVAVASALFYGLLMPGAMHKLAYVPDEQGALLQARTFAAGRLTPRVAPELVDMVTTRWVQDDIVSLSRHTGYYAAGYWPGYALLLSPFALFHVEWLCNPVLTALSLVGLFLLARRLSRSEEAGWWAVALMFCSAQVALQAASYFSMPAHLLFNIVFCLLFVRNTRRSAFAAGLVGGFALVLHNPVPHFSFALPWIVWMWRFRRAHLPPLLLGYALLFLPIGLGWSQHLQLFDPPLYTTGHAMSTGVSAHALGSQIVSRIATVVRPPDVWLLLERGAGLCKLVVWAMPGAAGLALLGWLEARRRRIQVASGQRVAPSQRVAPGEIVADEEHRFDAHYLWLLGVSLMFNFALYFAVRFDQGHGWGFRYLHQSWLALPLLGAFFLGQASPMWKRAAAILCVLGTTIVIPLRVAQMNALYRAVTEFRPPLAPNTPSITFVWEENASDVWIQNDPFLRDPHWNLRFRSREQNARLARRFLRDAHPVARGKWGETWTGTRFLKPGSP